MDDSGFVWGMSALTFTIVFGVATTVVGLIGGALINAHFARRERRVKQPLWCVWTATLANRFNTKNNSCQIGYDGESYNAVSISWIMFWNNGRSSLTSDDVDPRDRFRIVGSRQGKILDAKVVAATSPSSGAAVERQPDGSSATVSFDLLRHREGIVFQIVHSGDSWRFVELVGSFKEDEQLRRVEVPRSRYQLLPPAASVRGVYKEIPLQMTGRHWVFLAVLIIVAWASVFYWYGSAALVAAIFVSFLAIPATLMIMTIAEIFLSVREGRSFDTPINLDAINDEGESSREYWDRWVPSERPLLY